jgi:hypothetical protein
MNVFYLNKKGLWSRDSEDALLLFQPDYNKYYVLQSGAWIEVKKEDLSPLQKGYFWYEKRGNNLTLFRGVLPIASFRETLLSGLEVLDSHGLSSSAAELGFNFYLDQAASEVFKQRAKAAGAIFHTPEKKEEQTSFTKKIDLLLEEDLVFLREFSGGDISNRPLFYERGQKIRDLAERAMKNGEDVSAKLLLRAQIENEVDTGEENTDTNFLVLLELLHLNIKKSTLEDEGLWLHFPEGDIFIASDKRILLRGK